MRGRIGLFPPGAVRIVPHFPARRTHLFNGGDVLMVRSVGPPAVGAFPQVVALLGAGGRPRRPRARG